MSDVGIAVPAARRVRVLAVGVMALFALLAGRAVQLSLSGEPPLVRALERGAPQAPPLRADIVDRNGVLLATTLPSWTLAVKPTAKFSADDVRRLANAVPDLDAADVARRLAGQGALVYLKRGLTASQRQSVHDLGIPWVRFDEEARRVYPNRTLAGHALGFVNRELVGVAGVERALNARLAGDGRPVRLAIDARIQHAVEDVLADAAWGAKAKGAAALVLDGKTGETLALASWPALDANGGGAASEDARLDRLTGAIYETGSTVKPFTMATALDAKVASLNERFDVAAPLVVDGVSIKDEENFGPTLDLRAALAHSSNQVAATLALRVGAERQRAAFGKLGLLDVDVADGASVEKPAYRDEGSRLGVAAHGYGYAFQTSLLALAGAYTVFVNDGARVRPTLFAQDPAEPAPRIPVFSPFAAHETLDLMRTVVLEGTAKSADLDRFDIAGKTGTALKVRENGGYDPDRVLSSFVAIFPASAPRYVILLALDEPQRLPENKNLVTGGALAAPAVGRIAARAAPFLGLAPVKTPVGVVAAGGAQQ